MNAIWQTVEPYILTLIGALGGGGIIGIIASIICKRIISKASAAYDLNNFAAKVADRLGGKTLNIDMTAIAEKRLKEIADMLSEKVATVAEQVNSYKRILARIGEALTRLKMLSEDERSALAAAVKELDSEYVPPEKEIIATVKLEPVEFCDNPAAENGADAVNFG